MRNEDETPKDGAGNVSASADPAPKNSGALRSVKKPEAKAPAPAGILLSEVQAGGEVHWLWQDRLPIGKLTTLDGDPGLGKSSITLDLAARVSVGREMPDGTPGTAGGVVLISSEDGLIDTIQPRLRHAGADLSKIVFLGTIPTSLPGVNQLYERPFRIPGDLELLARAINRVRAKLVVIDPLTATLGKKDTYKDAEVRELLLPVQTIAETFKVAFLMVRHLTKTSVSNALYRSGGSIAFIAVARSGLMIFKDTVDEDKRILVHVKSNLGPLAPSLSFTMENEEANGSSQPTIHWIGKTSETIDELLRPPTAATNRAMRAGHQDILHLLQKCFSAPMSGKDLAEELPEMSVANLRTTLRRMIEDGQIKRGPRGQYSALSPAPEPRLPFVSFSSPAQEPSRENS